jgi:hypothetical protein
MSDMEVGQPQMSAGWYPEPTGGPGFRYWNGSSWDSAWLADKPGAVGYVAGSKAGTTNGLAIASLVLGIVWVYWIGSVLAIIFGAVALRQIGRRGQSGRGMAIAGLVLGIIGVGLFIVLVLIGAILSSADTGSTTGSFNTILFAGS